MSDDRFPQDDDPTEGWDDQFLSDSRLAQMLDDLDRRRARLRALGTDPDKLLPLPRRRWRTRENDQG